MTSIDAPLNQTLTRSSELRQAMGPPPWRMMLFDDGRNRVGLQRCLCIVRVTALSYRGLQRRQLRRSDKLFWSKLRRRAQLSLKACGPSRSEYAHHCVDTPQDQLNYIGQTESGAFVEYRINDRGKSSQRLDI